MIANSPIATVAAVMLPHEKVGSSNRVRSSSAERRTFSRCLSQKTNSVSATTAISMATGTIEIAASAGHTQPKIDSSLVGVHQPRSGPSMIANTRAPKPIALSSAPSTSAPGRLTRARVSGTVKIAPTKTSAPSGMLTRKIQCHDTHWVRAPPASGPIAAAPEITAPHTPKAAARYLPRNTAFTVESVAGMIIAAPRACTARAAISPAASPELAANTLPATNTTSPTRKSNRRPHRSASRPVDSSRAASTTA